MSSLPNHPWRSFGVVLLAGGLLAGSLTSCAARRAHIAETATAGAATAGAAGQPATASAIPGAAGTPTLSPADQLDAELDQMTNELNKADTLNDFTTVLPPDTPTPASVAPTSTVPAGQPTLASQPTTAPSSDDQSAQLDASLAALQSKLANTDTVPEGAHP